MRHLAIAGVALAWLAAAGSSGGQDLEAIQKAGVLKVICAADDQPELISSAAEAGPNPGFHREMIEGFAKLHGLRVQVVPVKTADDRLPALTRGDGDVVVAIVETEPRRKLAAFTVEVLPARHLAVSRKGKPISTLEELRAARVGVLKGSSWAIAAAEAGVPAAKTQEIVGVEDLVEALESGKIDATVMSISDFTLLARRHPDLEGGVFVGAAGRSSWALRKSSSALKTALDEYLGNVRKGSSWNRLIVKYFGEKALDVIGRARQ